MYDPRTASKLVASLPAGVATATVKLPGGYLIELATNT
jgi:hypothetical protein